MKSGISSDSAFYALCRKQSIKATRLKEHHFIVSQLPYYEGQEWDAKKTDRGIEVTIHPRDIETIKVPTWYNSFLSWANKFDIVVKYRASHIGYSEDFGFPDLGKHGWTLVTTTEWPEGVALPAFVKKTEDDENYYILLKNSRQESFKELRQKREKMKALIEQDIVRYLSLGKEEEVQESIKEWCDLMKVRYRKVQLCLDKRECIATQLAEAHFLPRIGSFL